MALYRCNNTPAPVPTAQIRTFNNVHVGYASETSIYYDTGLTGWSGAGLTSVMAYCIGGNYDLAGVTCSYNSSNGRVTINTSSGTYKWPAQYISYITVSLIVYKN